MYTANHYVRVGDILYKKGDIIPEDKLSEESVKFLLGAEAITVSASAVTEEPAVEIDVAESIVKETPEIQEVKPKRSTRKTTTTTSERRKTK